MRSLGPAYPRSSKLACSLGWHMSAVPITWEDGVEGIDHYGLCNMARSYLPQRQLCFFTEENGTLVKGGYILD